MSGHQLHPQMERKTPKSSPWQCRRPLERMLAIVLAALILLSACSSPTDPPEVDLSPTDSSDNASDSILRLFFDSVDDTPASLTNEGNRIYEEVTAECMRAAGFKYYVSERTGTAEPSSDIGVPQVGLGLFGQPEAPPVEKTAVDRNQEYVDGLDDAARLEYYQALVGFDPNEVADTDDPARGDTDASVLGSGCDGLGMHAQREFELRRTLEQDDLAAVNEQMDERLEAYEVEVEADSDVKGSLDKYVACLADGGFAISLPDSALGLLYEGPLDLVALIAREGSDFIDAVAANPGVPPEELLGAERVNSLRRFEMEARISHDDCVQGVRAAVFSFDDRFYAENIEILQQYQPTD